MNVTTDNILLIGSLLLVLSVLLTRTSSRFGIPWLLLFLVIGMLAGSDGIGGIHFNDPALSKFIGTFSLCYILFSGGLDTKWGDVKKVIWPGVILSTGGILITTVLVGVFTSLITNLSLFEGMLLGAIVSSTDAAAVFSILRSRGLGLKGKIRPLLELESGSNDPMAYFLTVFFIFLITNKEATFAQLIPLFLKQMAFGAIIGLGMGKAMQKILNWIKLEVAGLYSVLLMALMLLTFSMTDFIGGNGFLAVYLSAFTLGNTDFIHKRSLTKHFDGWAWLMQIILFLTLGMQVFPSEVPPYIGIGIAISVFLILIARPISIFISLWPFKLNFRSKLFISWVGLRGAVPIVFATYPLTLGMENSQMIFNVVFFITVSSILIQGTTVSNAAKLLGLSIPGETRKKSILDKEFAEKIRSLLVEVTVDENFSCIGKPIVDLKIPSNVLVVIIKRDKKYFIPDGSTIIQTGDKMMIMADDKNAISSFNSCISK